MTNREMALAVLRYQEYDRLPIVHFGYWRETLQKWVAEGHISEGLMKAHGDGNPADYELNAMLGWDFNWQCMFYPDVGLRPGFEHKVVRELDDGTKHVMNHNGVVLCQKPSAGSIPAEISHTLTDRRSWEEQYKFRYAWTEERVTGLPVLANGRMLPFAEGGLECLKSGERDYLYGLRGGSLFGKIRDIVGG